MEGYKSIYIDLEGRLDNQRIIKSISDNLGKQHNLKLFIKVTPEGLNYAWENVVYQDTPLLLHYPIYLHTSSQPSSNIESLPLKILFTTSKNEMYSENTVFEGLISQFGRTMLDITREFGCSTSQLIHLLRNNQYHIWHHKSAHAVNGKPYLLLNDRELSLIKLVNSIYATPPQLCFFHTDKFFAPPTNIPLMLTLSDTLSQHIQNRLIQDFYTKIIWAYPPEIAVHLTQRDHYLKNNGDSSWGSLRLRGNITNSSLFTVPVFNTPSGLPPQLHKTLIETLLQCQVCDNHETLKSIFIDARINRWRHDLPEARSPRQRVQQTIQFFHERSHQKQNGLILFLRVLIDRENREDICYYQLKHLLLKVESLLSNV